jgi:hypothetical protein
MFDRLLHAVTCGAAVVVLLAGPVQRSRLEAQDAAPYRARVDTLAALLQEAREAAARAESSRVAGVQIDSIVTGSLVILTTPAERARIEAASRRAWNQLTVLLRQDTESVGQLTFYLVKAGSREPRPLGADTIPTVVYSEKSDAVDIADRIIWRLEEETALGLDTVTFEWLGRRLPLRPSSPGELSRIYVDLATRPARVVRECYLGNLGRCEEALLVWTADDPVIEWYDAAERRDLVAQLWVPASQSSDQRRRACLDLGSDDACVEMLQRHWAYGLPPPLSVDAQRSLTALALELGGEGALGRFLDTAAADPGDRLTASSGLTLDSLVAAWHSSVLAARPPQTTIARRLGWTAFFWVLVLTFIASRSTRWRRA